MPLHSVCHQVRWALLWKFTQEPFSYQLRGVHPPKSPSLFWELANILLIGVPIPPLSTHILILTQQPERCFQDTSVHVIFSHRIFIVRAKDFRIPDNAHQVSVFFSDHISCHYSTPLLLGNHSDILAVPPRFSHDVASDLASYVYSPPLQTHLVLFIPALCSRQMKPMTDAVVTLALFFPVDLSNGEASRRSEGGDEHEVRIFPFISFLVLPSCSVGAGDTSLNLRSQLQSGRLSTQPSLPPSSNNHLPVTRSSLVMITALLLPLAPED